MSEEKFAHTPIIKREFRSGRHPVTQSLYLQHSLHTSLLQNPTLEAPTGSVRCVEFTQRGDSLRDLMKPDVTYDRKLSEDLALAVAVYLLGSGEHELALRQFIPDGHPSSPLSLRLVVEVNQTQMPKDAELNPHSLLSYLRYKKVLPLTPR